MLSNLELATSEQALSSGYGGSGVAIPVKLLGWPFPDVGNQSRPETADACSFLSPNARIDHAQRPCLKNFLRLLDLVVLRRMDRNTAHSQL
jgi:hypothetical protein